MARGDTLLNTVIGAVVTVILSFTGVSPILGGGTAGYLQGESRKSGAKVGALSGVFAFVPFLLFAAVIFGFFVAVPVTRLERGARGSRWISGGVSPRGA
ncbi:hypothetical protein AArcSl_2175 [Halalkaliarchaeum desulfuricum]|uniref:Uncharacterized protein n=1 Tax=Halalkaliarchaeum desulfuricum TaxID=2055893 RepID=A0A343TL28_9EURY|nr:hypothetical protein AArcSl_2175 [Halalkaliarchaeum desulfuricum]